MLNWISKLLPRIGKSAEISAQPDTAAAATATGQRKDAETWHKRGNTFLGEGDFTQAADCYRHALEIVPDFADACVSLAYILITESRHRDAGEYLLQALQIEPGNPDTHYMLGTIASARGDVDASIDHYRNAIANRPNFSEALHSLGNALDAKGKHEEAAESYRRALELNPNDVIACNNLGRLLDKRGEFAEAAGLFERILAIEPENAIAHNNLGKVLQEMRLAEPAIAHFQRAIAIMPDSVVAYHNLANALKLSGELDAAIDNYRKALSFNPDNAEIHNNLGIVHLEQGRLPEAIDCYRKALAILPDYASARSNLGLALQAQGELERALECHRCAHASVPDFAGAHWNESLCLLLMGNYEAGWKKYEWRWKNTDTALCSRKHEFVQPLWLGKESLQGKTILLWTEQGLGDTIQFCRYARLVAALGATVLLTVPAPLKPILVDLEGVSRILSEDDVVPPFDYQCPLMSLPLAFGTTIDTIPADIPYLHVDPAKRRQWQARLEQHTGLRVGLVWSGGFRADQPEVWSANKRRNIPLYKLAPLNRPGIDFFSLQVGDYGTSQLQELRASSWDGPAISDYTDAIVDFSDTAALIDNLDLVISVDTSTAHLAGAIGKPVWILNRFDTCWRWMRDRTDSPWYPSARLFRQPQPGDWDSVIADVAHALANLVQSRLPSRSNHVQLD
jgi:tetratricopeptide (TPR) repeat protein